MKKKFVTFKLVSLPTKSSGKAATGGDASLTMLLFEADSFTSGGSRNGGKKVYKGGSGGAFEKFWNLRVGTVVAILNPRVLRPMKVSLYLLSPACERALRGRTRADRVSLFVSFRFAFRARCLLILSPTL